MRIAVVGGGPAGLYFARLLKRSQPTAKITVFEQNASDATFGFGVGLGTNARDRIRQADPEVHDGIARAMVFTNEQNIHLNGTDTILKYSQHGGAIERLELLRILQDACRSVGVDFRSRTRVEELEQLDGCDLIVASDGVNSTLRALHADAFGTRTYHLTNHFAWYGVAQALRPSALVFRTTRRGHFVGHYYSYSEAMSTFVAECDDVTWHQSGMACMTDRERRALVEEVFAPELAGQELVENRSIWRQFPVVTNDRWHDGNTVLIGDALLSAHFSIGSGTRLAIDDAAALFIAVSSATSPADLPAALKLFQQQREPVRERFRQAAENSFNWYERLPEVMAQEPVEFVYDFLTRTGRIDNARLAQYCPGFYERYLAERVKRQAVLA